MNYKMNQNQKNLVQIEDLLDNNFNQQKPNPKTKLHKMNIAIEDIHSQVKQCTWIKTRCELKKNDGLIVQGGSQQGPN
jgi:hypothetical protein